MNLTIYKGNNNSKMSQNKSIKYLLTLFILSVSACSTNSNISLLPSKVSSSVYDLNLGPKGGGTIDPKITVGQTIINFKEGDGVLLFNLNLSGKGFTTKDITTSASTATTPSASPSPSASTTTTTDTSISKLSNEIYINEKKYLLDISSDKLSNNKHILNLTGLKKGDIVSLSTRVYDSKSQVVGKESVQNKEVKSDVESFDLNISLSINISQEQKTEVNVSQSQVVIGPTINITIPTPQSTPTPTPSPTNSQTQNPQNQTQGSNQNNPPPPPPPRPGNRIR